MSNQVNNQSVTPHPNAEVIKAWADGKVIQWLVECRNPWWVDYSHGREPGPWECSSNIQWRIKPEPKPDVVLWAEVHSDGECCSGDWRSDTDNLKLTFDGETGELKSAEVLDVSEGFGHLLK